MRAKSSSSAEKPEGATAGIKAVAKRAGVGIGSVSRVFSGHPDVSDEMRRRVHKAAESLSYSPNVLAQSLRSRATRSVGFVVADIANPLLSSIVHGAETVLSAAGYSVLLTNSGGQPSTDAERVRLLQQRQVDGLMILPAMESSPDLHKALSRMTGPVVIIDRTLPPKVRALYVLSDHYAGVTQATYHLLDLGHRRIGVIVGQDVRPTRERMRAVRDAYTARKLEPQFIVDKGPLSVEHGAAALRRFLGSADPPTAVLLGGNQLLEGALEVVREHNIQLGKKLSLICCDDVPLSRLFETPISTVMRDTVLIGQTAAQMLLTAISDSQSPAKRKISPTLLSTWYEPRKSCGAPSR